MAKQTKDLKGKVFGKLTVLEFYGIDIKAKWKCLCSCGKETIVFSYNLTNGHTISCGCARGGVTHRGTGTPLYNKWANMKHRVVSDDPIKFNSYKGRGITVCERWQDYANFKEDMLLSYNVHTMLHGKKNTTLERKDNDGNYCPENCCWATQSEQINNRRV